jgi:hypothetical protein
MRAKEVDLEANEEKRKHLFVHVSTPDYKTKSLINKKFWKELICLLSLHYLKM